MENEPTFFDKVFEVAALIPYGRVTSYGAIAKYIGSPKASRMVGYAMNGSGSKNVPAHRVVNRLGMLTGKHHFGGSNIMQEMLENEGHIIEEQQIMNFNELFWNPMEEL